MTSILDKHACPVCPCGSTPNEWSFIKVALQFFHTKWDIEKGRVAAYEHFDDQWSEGEDSETLMCNECGNCLPDSIATLVNLT